MAPIAPISNGFVFSVISFPRAGIPARTLLISKAWNPTGIAPNSVNSFQVLAPSVLDVIIKYVGLELIFRLIAQACIVFDLQVRTSLYVTKESDSNAVLIKSLALGPAIWKKVFCGEILWNLASSIKVYFSNQ